MMVGTRNGPVDVSAKPSQKTVTEFAWRRGAMYFDHTLNWEFALVYDFSA